MSVYKIDLISLLSCIKYTPRVSGAKVKITLLVNLLCIFTSLKNKNKLSEANSIVTEEYLNNPVRPNPVFKAAVIKQTKK